MSHSLWLVPRENTPFTKEIQELITSTVPSNYSQLKEKHNFIPHITVTSGIDPSRTFDASKQTPQEWLNTLSLPTFKKEHDEVILELDHLEASDAFFKKLTIRLSDNDNLNKLAARCRLLTVLSPATHDDPTTTNSEATAQTWSKNEYQPHLSLLYADLPKADIQKRVPLIELQLGFSLGSLFDCCGGTLSQGGELVLVDTSKPISEWKPIATRETPWAMWRMSRDLV